jgi:hypothetical protein
MPCNQQVITETRSLKRIAQVSLWPGRSYRTVNGLQSSAALKPISRLGRVREVVVLLVAGHQIDR